MPGYLTFFTNYLNRARAPNWPPIRARPWSCTGTRCADRYASRARSTPTTAAEESDAYFASRAWQSRIGAWASQQSAPIAVARGPRGGRRRRGAALRRAHADLQSDDDAPDPGIAIPRPPHWGGYHLWVEAVELWVEGAARLHDRARWTRTLEPAAAGFTGRRWSATRLQPVSMTSRESLVPSPVDRRRRRACWCRTCRLGVRRGEFLAILGRNGSGKTPDAARARGAVNAARRGRVLLDGADLRGAVAPPDRAPTGAAAAGSRGIAGTECAGIGS